MSKRQKRKQTTYRAVMMRLNKTLENIELAILNPALFDTTLPEISDMVSSNINYLKRIEKMLDRQMSKVGSLLNNYEKIQQKLELKKKEGGKDWCGVCSQ
jgi:hypothetical protein